MEPNFDAQSDNGFHLEIMPYWEEGFAEHYPNSHFVRWDHWPVNQIRAFGRGADTSQYPSHTSLFHMAFNSAFAQGPNWQTRILLTGVTDFTDGQILDMTQAWLQAPIINQVSGATAAQYDKSERAYRLTATDKNIAFTLAGSSAQAVINPAIVIDNWQGADDINIKLNGQMMSDAKVGLTRNINGEKTLVIFVPTRLAGEVKFEIAGV